MNTEFQETKLVEWLREIFPDCDSPSEELAKTLSDNPGRISRAYRALLEGYLTQPKELIKVALEVPNRDHYGLVSSTQIPFLSFCVHHFLPFYGHVDIVYEPGLYIIGIGKMPRLVECHARRFQLQETLVRHLAEDMMNHASAKGVYVKSTAHHLCVCYRGPEMPSIVSHATYALGSLSEAARLQEAISLLRG